MKENDRKRLGWAIAAWMLTAVAAAADDVTMGIAPAFDGYSPRQGTVPVAVDFENSGPDTSVTLHVDTDDYHMTYPLELPRGATKRLITYPNLTYGQAQFTAQTSRGVISKTYEAPATLSDQSQTVLMVADSAGDLAFMRGKSNGEAQTAAGRGSAAPPPGFPPGSPPQQLSMVQDAYILPSLAPDRPVGYAPVAAVILGAGAERLRDEQVAALRTYATLGGTLVFIGGASAPLLNDPRWQDVLPAHQFRAVTLPSSDVLGALGNFPAPRASMMTGAPIAGSSTRYDRGVLITAERTYGIGRICYLAFNPFEAPLSRWDGRRDAMLRTVRPLDGIRAANYLRNFGGQEDDRGPRAYTYTVTYPAMPGSRPAYPAGSGSYPDNPANDPFSIKLPSAEFIFTLLALYFLVVIPVNFLVLKRLKRGEWAWFTAPVISLLFAAEFFSRASDLYSGALSTASQGIIIAQEGERNGMFVGATQMFIPHGGAYDLKLVGVDSLSVDTSSFDGYRVRSSRDNSDLNAVDVGEVRVPRLPADNLSFREMDYRQFEPVSEWFSIRVIADRKVEVRNAGPYTLTSSQVVVGNRSVGLIDLPPGQSTIVPLDRAAKLPDVTDPSHVNSVAFATEIAPFLSRNRAVALVGTLEGFRPGPQIGKSVGNRTRIQLALVAKEALGPS